MPLHLGILNDDLYRNYTILWDSDVRPGQVQSHFFRPVFLSSYFSTMSQALVEFSKRIEAANRSLNYNELQNIARERISFLH